MHLTLDRSRSDERDLGTVAIVVALSLTGLLVVAAMVLDFGLVRMDRQSLKSDADSAAMAGLAAGDGGTGDVYTFRAVCGALGYLKATSELSGLPDDFCPATSSTVKCVPTDTTTHALYDHQVTSGGATYRVVIKAPYVLTSDGWNDEDLTSLANDQSTMDGCDQLAVEIFSNRKPGLGSLATSGDLRFGIRSAARASIGGDGQLAPALMILERKTCSALTVGSAGLGSGTFINVKGSASTPGSIHLDSDATGSDCGSGSNQQLVQGKQNDGIVAYGSVSPTGASGIISSVATYKGVANNVVYDSLAQVYGTTSTSGTGSDKNQIVGRSVVGRTPVDKRYRQAVRDAIASAKTDTNSWGTSPPAGQGWTTTNCSPSASDLNQPKLWINCPGNPGLSITGTINSQYIYVNGFIKSNANIAMPNALRVYVRETGGGSSGAVNLTNGAGFCVRATCGTTVADKCSTSSTANRAQVIIRQGGVSASGGTLRLCNTTMIMLGNDTDYGCVPDSNGTVPTATPCPSSSAGTGLISLAGGANIDWTAPNEYANAVPEDMQASAYSNLEDLAFWSESAGPYKFSGGGGMNTVGVYMAPNGTPVNVGGGSSQNLTNAQYFARTFSVTGGGTLTLTVDPNNVVTIPSINGYTLVR